MSGLMSVKRKPGGRETLRILLLGDSGVGKAHLLQAFDKHTFDFTYNRCSHNYWIPSFVQAHVDVDGENHYCLLCNPFDSHRMSGLEPRPFLVDESTIVVLCFSLVNPDSFRNIEHYWLSFLADRCPDTPHILVGLQSDARTDDDAIKQLASKNEQPISREEG